jgi:hypothetical protein
VSESITKAASRPTKAAKRPPSAAPKASTALQLIAWSALAVTTSSGRHTAPIEACSAGSKNAPSESWTKQIA